jgi:hypothetical protein
MNSLRTARATRRPVVVALTLLVCAAALAQTSCTEAKLEKIPPRPIFRDDKLSISGEICTREPETLTFPLRVLFVIDSSVSMDVTDPPDPVSGETGRERAVRETWTRLIGDGREGVRVGIVRFSAQARSRTATDINGDMLPDTFFTADENLLDTATRALRATDRTTNYVNALGEAYYEMRTELIGAELESLPLSKYVVIFLSDGVPDVDSSDERGDSRQAILDQVRALRELADTFRVGDFSFHTVYLSSGQESFDQRAQSLLKRMADLGDGNFRSFPNGEELNFLFVDFTVLRRLFTLQTLSAVNLNAVKDFEQVPMIEEPPDDGMMAGGADMGMMGPDAGATMPDMGTYPRQAPVPELSYVDVNSTGRIECGEPLADTDGDGLSDVAEHEIGTNPFLRDTDDDGLNDQLEWSLRDDGLDPLDPEDSQCFIPNPCVDEDDDGFCDCVLDTDADGVCNCEEDDELRCQDDRGHDCVDEELDEDGNIVGDGFCDCPDFDEDGRCDYDDRDGDGLHDCEEVLYGTAQNGNDTDADGLPDNVEVRFGTNPAKADQLEDVDNDRTLNGIEVLANTNPVCDDTAMRSRTAYRYSVVERGLEGARSCYDFSIGNITLVPTLSSEARPGEEPVEPARYPGDGSNRILIYAGEVSFDDPNAFASYRVACVEASYYPDGNYKNPPSGRFRLEEDDFVDAEEFDAEMHCKTP